LDLIEAHRRADGALGVALVEVRRRDEMGAPDDDSLMSGPCHDETAALTALLNAVPTTIAGVGAWVIYLADVAKHDPWKVDDTFTLPLLAGLSAAFGRAVLI
jgi:hypothetical protein